MEIHFLLLVKIEKLMIYILKNQKFLNAIYLLVIMEKIDYLILEQQILNITIII